MTGEHDRRESLFYEGLRGFSLDRPRALRSGDDGFSVLLGSHSGTRIVVFLRRKCYTVPEMFDTRNTYRIISIFMALALFADGALAAKCNWMAVLSRSADQSTAAATHNYAKVSTPGLKDLLVTGEDEESLSMVIAVVFSGEEFRKSVVGGWRSAGIKAEDERTLGSRQIRDTEYTATYYQMKISAPRRVLRSMLGNNQIVRAGLESERELVGQTELE